MYATRSAALLLSATLVTAAIASGAAAAPRAKRRGHVRRRGVQPTLTVHRTKYGPVIANGAGFTLYMFAKDKNGKSSCYGPCASVWPPLLKGKGRLILGKGVRRRLVGFTRRSNGTIQITYAHHPLYTYVPDAKPGEVHGEGILSFGARWYVISPSGRVITPKGR